MSTRLDSSTELEAPKIEFPCLYPIKIIGVASSRISGRGCCGRRKTRRENLLGINRIAGK